MITGRLNERYLITMKSIMTINRCSAAAVAALMVAAEAGAFAADANPGAAYNISLVTDSTPDLTDIESYLRSITAQYSTPQDKAVSIWRWSRRLRKQTTNPVEDGFYVIDPIRMFNSYGYCNCGIVSGVNNSLWLNMGWQAHYVQLGDHTVCETSWDGSRNWHMFDSSMSIYCFNDAGNIASVPEIEKNPRFYLQNFGPNCGSNPVRDANDFAGWRASGDGPVRYHRTLADGYSSFAAPNEIFSDHLAIQYGARYVLNLRPGENYTRYFDPLPLDGKKTFRPVRGTMELDVDEGGQVSRGNGIWHYAPNLREAATRHYIYSDSGVTWTSAGVRGPGSVTFKVAAANAVTSAEFKVAGKGLSLKVSRDAGQSWTSLTLENGMAEAWKEVAGQVEYLARVELTGADSGLESFVADTITQLNRAGLPRLVQGPNRIQVRLGEQLETIQFHPNITNRESAFAWQNLDIEAKPYFYKPTLRPAENNTPAAVTWRVEAPTPIVKLIYGGNVCVKNNGDRVTLSHSWNDADYAVDFQKTDPSPPSDLVVNQPVKTMSSGASTAFLKYEFATKQFARNHSGPGIITAMATIQHQPRVTKTAPVEVTYCWIEYRDSGEVERQHTEIIKSAAHEYVINVGGARPPGMKWIRMNLQGQGPQGVVKAGYSDGENLKRVKKPEWVRNTWGNNFARGHDYRIEGAQDALNPDAGLDLTDGIIAPPDTYVSAKDMPTGVAFPKDTAPTVTLDLGSAQKIASVRVHTMQGGKENISHPNHITVETSVDGKKFSPAGSAEFAQIFAPPAEFEPWELDDSRQFAHLPAGGRLAFGYAVKFKKPAKARYIRVHCEPRKGWGMLLSEIEAFDTVENERNIPPLVFLPPLAKSATK